jgi:hypothetical protein
MDKVFKIISLHLFNIIIYLLNYTKRFENLSYYSFFRLLIHLFN